jgi:hypothetical protein
VPLRTGGYAAPHDQGAARRGPVDGARGSGHAPGP